MMEAMRILKASRREAAAHGPHRPLERGGGRPARLAAYVKEHFGDRETMALKPAQAKLSGYFNVDNGTGAIRGVYLQGNEAVAPIFQAWMEPFKNLGMTTLTIRNTGGTDHLSFDAVGLPGFQFMQDELEYDTRTHHSNMDVYERAAGRRHDEATRSSSRRSSTTRRTATRSCRAKPLPKAQPPQGQTPPARATN